MRQTLNNINLATETFDSYNEARQILGVELSPQPVPKVSGSKWKTLATSQANIMDPSKAMSYTDIYKEKRFGRLKRDRTDSRSNNLLKLRGKKFTSTNFVDHERKDV